MNGTDVKAEIDKVRCPQCYYSQGVNKCPSSEKYLALPTKTCADRHGGMKCPKGTAQLENLDKINGTSHETCCKWATCDTYSCATNHPGRCNKPNPETIKRPDEALGAHKQTIRNYCCESGSCEAENSPIQDTTTHSSTARPTALLSTLAPSLTGITVSGIWAIAMENASKLWKNAEGLAAFKKALKKVIAQLLNLGLIKENHIQVDIAQSSGSRRLSLSSSSAKGLKATYTITVPKEAEATTVATRINSKSTENLKTAVNSALMETAQAVPDMKDLTSSGVIIIAEGSLSASTPVVSVESEPESDSDVSVSSCAATHGAVIVSFSALVAMTSLMTSQ